MAAQGSKPNLLPMLAGALVIAAGVGFLRGRTPVGAPDACDESRDPLCDGETIDVQFQRSDLVRPPELRAQAACIDVGYLCAPLADADRLQLRRWKDFTGTLIVHVPRPDFEESGVAARLQEAAARGLRAWNDAPFPILTDLRGDRGAHFAVSWSRGLGGNQIGVARTQWSNSAGLSVIAIELSTRSPFDPSQLSDERQIQLTAAHEMGHALGLSHSDARQDVMYPSNTASSMSARDYRTMEALYELADGTEIVR
jgi:hypothetical protein